MIAKLSRLIELLSFPSLGVSLIYKKGFSISSYRMTSLIASKIPLIATVIDVGQFALACENHWPESIIHSFEPIPSAFTKLIHISIGYSNICQ